MQYVHTLNSYVIITCSPIHATHDALLYTSCPVILMINDKLTDKLKCHNNKNLKIHYTIHSDHFLYLIIYNLHFLFYIIPLIIWFHHAWNNITKMSCFKTRWEIKLEFCQNITAPNKDFTFTKRVIISENFKYL